MLPFQIEENNKNDSFLFLVKLDKSQMRVVRGENSQKLVVITYEGDPNISWEIYSKLLRRTQSECRSRFPGYEIELASFLHTEKLLQFGVTKNEYNNYIVSKIDSKIGV